MPASALLNASGVEVATDSAPDALFFHDRPVPPEWQQALMAVCPTYDGCSWFLLAWEPGEPHDDALWVQRYVIWQMQSPAITKKLILREHPGTIGFHEEHPRKNAVWSTKLACYVKPDGKLAKTDKLTWELYHKTGCYGSRFWVIQGETGGHRYNLSHVEKQVLTLGSNGHLRDVPKMGDLPYAPFDHRVIPHFEKIEQAAMARKIYKYASARLDQLDQDERTETEYARCLLFDYLGEQFGALYDEFRPFYKEQLRKVPVPVGAKPEHTDGDELKDRFVRDV